MNNSAGFIGLGSMGSAMACNLLKHQVKLYVNNRTKEKAADLIAKGAVFVDSPAEIFQKTSIVFTMVANDDALKDITLGNNGILANAKPGCIHVSMSTVSPEITKELHTAHQEKGVEYLAAPVFGRPEAAEHQKLWIAVAGAQEPKKQVLPFLSYMGQKTYDLGDAPEIAIAVKLSGNFLILSTIEALSEAYAFAKKNGVDLHTLNNFLGETILPSPAFITYGQQLISQQFEPAGFKMVLGYKDISLLLKTADHLRVPMPLAGLLHDRQLTALANNRGNKDWSAISLTTFENAGLANS